MLGSKIAFGASGFGEFLDQVEAGQVRVLAVTSEKPVEALKDVPTLKASGIDLVFTNWRGIVAPPEISDADKKVWIDALTKMHDSQEWKAELTKHGWTDAFVTGDEFGTFLTEQDKAVADILTRARPGMSYRTSDRPSDSRHRPYAAGRGPRAVRRVRVPRPGRRRW